MRGKKRQEVSICAHVIVRVRGFESVVCARLCILTKIFKTCFCFLNYGLSPYGSHKGLTMPSGFK